MRVLPVLLLMPLLTACNYTMNQNSIIANDVQSAPLDNGKTLDVGYKLPDAAAACQLIDTTSTNWAIAESKGELKFGGGRQVLMEAAVASVNQRPQDGINYVALTIPNETDIISIDVTAEDNATTSYFRCATPP
jgi:hypothetical protein